MELILISNTKLKIMLDESDMKQYNIGSESDCAKGSTRKAIRSLLDRARDQIGFDTDGQEIFVQLYASRRGGCELFVTKCAAEEKNERELIQKIKSPTVSVNASGEKGEIARRLPERRSEERAMINLPEGRSESLPAPREKRSSRIAYSFEDMASLLKVCKILNTKSMRAESSAYKDDSGGFYLLLTDTGTSAYSRLDALTFITEYGRRENPDCLISYISEHGSVICGKNAVGILAKL